MDRSRFFSTAILGWALASLLVAFGAPPAEAAEPIAKRSLAPARPLELYALRLRSHRLDDIRQFYGEVLELPVIRTGEGFVIFRVGSTRLRFDLAQAGQEPTYHFAIEVPENKVGKAVEWLRARHEVLEQEGAAPYVHVPLQNAHSIYFSDPVGNHVELVGHHALPTAVRGEFTAKDFLRISEIGLVVNRFPRVADLMVERLGLKRLLGPRTQRYGVFGDEGFSFVVVEKGLTWARTEQPALPFPVTAVMRGERGSLLIADMPFVLRLRE